jgi:hypothetical protein
MKIFCYRDNLEGEKYKYYGVTLYFVAGEKVNYDTDIHVKPEKRTDVLSAIAKLLNIRAPVIQFVLACIEAGTGKTRCYNDARAAGVSIRKQNQLALYDYLEENPPEEEETFPKTDEEIYTEIKSNDYFYEQVQDHFAEQLYKFMGMGYETSGLSECEAPTDVREGDFIFEIGRLQSAKLQYFGHYRPGGRGWLNLKIFDEFDIDTLEAIIDDNT